MKFPSHFLARATAAGALLASVALWLTGQASVQVGYTVVTVDAGNSIPMGSALFTYRNSSGVLVSEAGVGSADLMRSGRIFVDEAGTKTGVALVNPSPQSSTAITLILRDAAGTEIDRQPLTLGPRQQTARYISDWFSKQSPGFTGSLTFISTGQAVAAITLRESRNTQDEPLYTTLPVVDLGASATNQPIVLPQIAAGDGYATQLVLINSGSQTLSGRVRLFADDGNPLLVRVQNNTVTELGYSIAPEGTYREELSGVSGLGVGYAVVIPDAGSITPAGSAIFQFKPGGRLMTEAGVGAVPATTAARIFVDYVGAQTGIAVANPGDQPADLTLTLMDRYGSPEASVHRIVEPRHHFSRFVHELFPAIADGYGGLMEIRSASTSAPFVPITLKLTMNARNDLVLTTLPVADLTRPAATASMVFPQIALGAGFSTRLILLNTSTSNVANGRLTFFQQDGNPLTVPMGGQTGTGFEYPMVPGGGRQFYPGNTATIASVSLVEPLSNRITSELVINEGDTRRPGLQIVDDTGGRRDDFDAAINSFDSDVAAVDASGGIQGKKAGFSTLVITVAGRVITATATVVKVNAGVAGGFAPIGVVQDSARRLYLASAQADSILLAQDLKQTPQTYAGIPGNAGLKNDLRLQSLFDGPSFLALNQAEGSLYVSDGANHVIRRVKPGPSGRVDTLAGTGVAGSQDGAIGVAAFNNPQGIALDERGNLWVADSGNHTIRRINLVRGSVETIAGQAGVSGSTDGSGAQARFRSPAGIAIESQTAVQQLAQTGASLPRVSVIVADSGNGLIRRVKENGDVETIGSVPLLSKAVRPGRVANAASGPVSAPARFASPTGVAVDPAGNIYVSEPGSGQVKAILRTGEIVLAAEAGTFVNPTGLALAQNGKVVVAAADRAARELVYAGPRIASISPDEVSNKGGQTITIKGSNFAPDTLVAVSGVVISGLNIVNTQTITFTSPPLPSGRGTLTIQNRGGLAQKPVLIDAVPLHELPAGYITTVAGGSTYAGEGALATASPMWPSAVAVDTNGNVFVTDQLNRKARRIDGRTGILTTVAGNGQDIISGDNGPAVAAGISAYPGAIAFDRAGNLLIAGGGIRRIDVATGIITTIVGGQYGSCGDGGNALDACFKSIAGLTVDAQGNLYIADGSGHRIRRVDAKTNIITTIAGNGVAGLSGDNGDARAASLNDPSGVVVDSSRGALYIADSGNLRVRKVDLTTNMISSIAGGGTGENDTGDARATAAIIYPNALALDSAGNLFISDRGNSRIRRLDITSGILTTIAGSGAIGSDGDGGLATLASLHDPGGVAVDAAGNVWITDFYAYVVRRVDAATQIITTVAGNRQSAILDDGAPATAATLRIPFGVAVDPAGNLFITDAGNDRIRRVDAATGIINTIAGGGRPAEGIGDGGLATNASLTTRGRVRFDEAGNLYIAGRFGSRVRRVQAGTNIITTVAGNGRDESSGDGGPAINAGVRPDDIAVDRRGNLYLAEGDNPDGIYRIRKVNLSTGVITTIAGGGAGPGIDDNGPAIAARLGAHLRISVDKNGNLFIVDADNGKVRRIDAQTQIITTVAGGGTSYMDNQVATSVGLFPVAVDVDAAGNLFILDWAYPLAIRKVAVATGIISTVAAFGVGDPSPTLGDNGPTTAAFLYYPEDVTVDAQGNLFIADTDNQRIRAVRGPIP